MISDDDMKMKFKGSEVRWRETKKTSRVDEIQSNYGGVTAAIMGGNTEVII